ncbi:MAG: hypothetical protein ABID54_06020 [Pseudomonadota bacterium]
MKIDSATKRRTVVTPSGSFETDIWVQGVKVSQHGWTPNDGMEVQGKVVTRHLRGLVVVENGRPARETG